MTVFDQAFRWAKQHYPQLEGSHHNAKYLFCELSRLLPLYPGLSQKRWLFLYSPGAASSLFELSEDMVRVALASAKLAGIAMHGGMLLGADFSEGWGTPSCVGKIIPLVVVSSNEDHAPSDEQNDTMETSTSDEEIRLPERYWHVEESDKEDRKPTLVWCENPYGLYSDYLDFEIVEWHSKDFTIEQVANDLQNTTSGMGDLDNDGDIGQWEMCRHVIFRNAQPVCTVEQTTGSWCTKSDDSNDFLHKDTRRMYRHGCSHRLRKDHVRK